MMLFSRVRLNHKQILSHSHSTATTTTTEADEYDDDDDDDDDLCKRGRQQTNFWNCSYGTVHHIKYILG